MFCLVLLEYETRGKGWEEYNGVTWGFLGNHWDGDFGQHGREIHSLPRQRNGEPQHTRFDCCPFIVFWSDFQSLLVPPVLPIFKQVGKRLGAGVEPEYISV